MGSTFYNGVPIEDVDFREEFEKELEQLEKNLAKIKEKSFYGKFCWNPSRYQFWALKLANANKALANEDVTLS
mgnify:CR=1 FL=1